MIKLILLSKSYGAMHTVVAGLLVPIKIHVVLYSKLATYGHSVTGNKASFPQPTTVLTLIPVALFKHID